LLDGSTCQPLTRLAGDQIPGTTPRPPPAASGLVGNRRASGCLVRSLRKIFYIKNVLLGGVELILGCGEATLEQGFYCVGGAVDYQREFLALG
jgi:hypothetical protein